MIGTVRTVYRFENHEPDSPVLLIGFNTRFTVQGGFVSSPLLSAGTHLLNGVKEDYKPFYQPVLIQFEEFIRQEEVWVIEQPFVELLDRYNVPFPSSLSGPHAYNDLLAKDSPHAIYFWFDAADKEGSLFVDALRTLLEQWAEVNLTDPEVQVSQPEHEALLGFLEEWLAVLMPENSKENVFPAAMHYMLISERSRAFMNPNERTIVEAYRIQAGWRNPLPDWEEDIIL